METQRTATPRRRVYRTKVKYDHVVYPRRMKKLGEIPIVNPVDEWGWEWTVLEELEERVFESLTAYGVDSALWPYYVGYAKQVWERRVRLSGVTLQGEIDVYTDVYVLRRLSRPILESLIPIALYCAELKLGLVSLEGTYTHWNLVWCRDYGPLADLRRCISNNSGIVYAPDDVPLATLRTRSKAGAEADLANALTTINVMQSYSVTQRYVAFIDILIATLVRVLRDQVEIWTRNISSDCPGPDTISSIVGYPGISPNARYIAMIGASTLTGNNRYLLLYEGAP